MDKKIRLILSLVFLFAALLHAGNSCYGAREDTISLKKYAKVAERLQGDQDAVKYIHRGLRQAQTEQHYYYQLFFTIQMGDFYRMMNINDEAMSYYLQALGLSDIVADSSMTIEVLNGLSDIYITNNMPEKAKQFNNRSVNMLDSLTKPALAARSYEIRAKIYYEQKQWYKALDAAEQAQAIYAQQHNNEGVIRQWLMMARIYEQNNVQQKAEHFLKKALSTLDEIDSGEIHIAVFSERASLFREIGELDSALAYLNKGIAISRAESLLKDEEELLKKKASLLETMGKTDEALRAYHRRLQLQDTIGEQEMRRNMQRLEVQYRTERQKARNKLLQEQLEKKNETRNILIVASLMLLVALVALIVFRRYKKQQRVSASLESFNNELERRVSQKTRELEIEMEERKKKSEEAQAAQKKAEESDRLKTEFLQNISHEVRTPMNRISGYSDMLAEISENAEEREYAAIIKKDTERLLKLITDIIELAQLASEDIQPDFSEITVKDFFRRIRAHHTPEFPQQIAFRVIIPQELEGQKIYTDTGRLQKVFGHLIGNALKFTKEGYVELAAGRNKDNFTFTVADSGAGIDGDKLDFIFDYFRQVDGSSTRSAGGVGAGLTLVKHLTEILGGSVYVTSTKGKGTTVSLTFPWRALQKESLKQKQVAHHNKSTDMPWQGKHIVVLDDRLSNVEFINAALKKTGVTISRKHSAEELLKDLPEGAKTDLVIINNKDYKVSEEQTAQIKASNYTLPVIMLTAATADFSPLEAVADEVLTLPVSYKVLLERISKVFNNNRH